jgi:23S rRNA pseudouridine1911/1915/1917 synthase
MIELESRILLEDNHLLIINKPSGLLVQPDKETNESVEVIVKEYIKKKYDKPGEVFLGVCHRIDRPVSGIVVLARTSKSLVRLNEMFKTREVKKTYWAVVENAPKEQEGTLVHWMKKDGQKNISRAYDKQVEGSVKAELSYKLIGKSDRYFLLEVNPVSGRHHQIRVQLSKMGCSIKGDVKYGAKRTNKDGGIHLHARKIEFMHPVKKEPVQVVAPVPDEVVWKAISASL